MYVNIPIGSTIRVSQLFIHVFIDKLHIIHMLLEKIKKQRTLKQYNVVTISMLSITLHVSHSGIYQNILIFYLCMIHFETWFNAQCNFAIFTLIRC